MSFDIVGITQAESLMLILAAATALEGNKGRVTANPLMTARGLYQWRRRIAAKAAMFAGDGFCLGSVVAHNDLKHRQIVIG